MSFGLINVPAVFQHYIIEILREALDHYMFVYLDDILIYNKNQDKSVAHVSQGQSSPLSYTWAESFIRAEKESHIVSVGVNRRSRQFG